MSNKRSCPYKTLNGLEQLSGTSLLIDNITIQGPTSYPTYTLTLPPNDGSPGQILSTNGSGVLSWVNDISGGTVTSVSATVPAWLSVTVTNPTTTPAIAITGTSTGTGTVTVLQDSPTINTLLTVTGQVDISRNSGSGHAVKITNAHAGVQDNYIEIGKNSSNRNHAHFGHHFVSSGDSGNYAYMQTNNNLVKFFGAANFTFPATTGVNGQLLTTDGTGVTSWSNAVASVSASSPITSTGGTAPTIGLTTVPVTLGGTGLTTVGTNGQVLASNGTTLFWQTPTTNPGTVTSVSASVPGLLSVTVSNPTSTPAIAIGYSGTALPTANGGTGLTTIGTTGQVLSSTGTGLQYVTLPTPVTSVTATSPIVSSGGATPDLSLSTVPTTLGGTGLTTVGTSGQVLTSNGTSLTWATPTTGTVTSVAATSPLASSGGATPTISIASSTGTGSVVLNTDPELQTSVNLKAPVLGEGYLRFVSASNTNYIQTALSNVSGSIADLVIGSHTNTSQLMIVKASGNVGIGTTTPAQKLTVESGRIRIDDTTNAVLELKTNAFISYAYTDAGGSFIVAPSNQIRFEGITSISKPGGQQLYIDSSDGYAFMAFAPNNVRKCFFGFAYGGGATKNLVLVNEYTDGGDIEIDCNWASARIRCIKPILLQETVTLRKHPSSTTYSFGFPTSMGTSGQVLTTDGTDTYWGSGGGGGSGTVTSVSASVPAFLSVTVNNPTTTPDIAISGTSTGTGSVVLQTSPTINDTLAITNPTTTFFNSIESYAPNLGTSHSNSIRFGKSSTTGEHGFLRYLQQATAAASSISLGLGSTQIAINGAGQFTIPGGILQSSTWSILSAVNISSSSATLTVNNNSNIFSNFTTFSVLAPNLQTGAGIQIRLGTATSDNTGITFGWKTNTTVADRYAYFETASVERLVINTGGNIGIGTSSPTHTLHVNGSLRVQGALIEQNGGESKFSNGSYFDPVPGQAYNAKFGNTDPNSNGIAVKGNSRFTGSVFAYNFTTNLTDYFTYYESTDPSLCTMQGSNLFGGTFGIDCIDSAFIFVTDTQVSVTRIGKIVTVSFLIEFSYNSNPTPGFTKMAIVLKYPSIRTPANVTNMYAQGICNWPTSISGVGNPLSVTAYNCTAQGVAAVALLVTGSAGLVDYNTSFAQSNQRLTGSITYVIR